MVSASTSAHEKFDVDSKSIKGRAKCEIPGYARRKQRRSKFKKWPFLIDQKPKFSLLNSRRRSTASESGLTD